jgi:acyl-coenzyme A synthetase/AMP-(fatty) acid ligase
MELWPNLAAGASCHLPDEETRLSPEKLRDWLVSERINTCFAPTPLAEMLLPLSWPRDTALRFLHTGGDKLHRFPGKSLGFRLMNNYGPTECTVLATSCQVESEEGRGQSPPIGRPIDNAEVYLLDEDLRPVPAGVRGEVYVGGAGLSRGYLGRPAQTAAAFIPHPFSASPGARLYRTGDLARHLPDGQIEFLGRLDGQVKIRGHRIELGEVEVALGAHASVRGCVVDCREAPDGDKRLTAYVVPEEGARPGVGELRAYLAEMLPGYMVPSAFVLMEQLPLTANGKLDRRALPEVNAWTAGTDAAYVAPATEMERTVASLWQELLGLERVGTHDNFFDLGGHSLLMVRMQSRLQEILSREVAIVELFKYPTVSTLAQHLGREPRGERDGAATHRQRAHARRESVEGRARHRQGGRIVNRKS